MKIISPANYAKYVAMFERHFDLNARVPEFVFRARSTHKLVIKDSGAFHKMEVFERLGATYQDKNLYSLITEPEATDVFNTPNRLLAYVLPFGSDFRKSCEVDLLGFGDFPERLPKSFPWMIAGLQCYIGSNEVWCSYHDNHGFELDMFYVPYDCDTLQIFGEAPWNFEDIEVILTSHHSNTSKLELQKLRENYFK